MFLFLLVCGCTKNENPVQVKQTESIIGRWNISSMTFNDSVVNYDDQYGVIRRVEVNSDSSIQLYYYNKLILVSVDTGKVNASDTSITVIMHNPMDIVEWYYRYAIEDRLIIYDRLPGVNRKFIYDKE